MQITINSLSQTKKLAKKIAIYLQTNNLNIGLSGTLGAGKTTLVREVLLSMGITGSVKSPTYNLVETYNIISKTIHHFDLYRFIDEEEWFSCGFDEYLELPCCSFIEWYHKADLSQVLDLTINIELLNEQRTITISPLSNNGTQCLNQLTSLDETY